MVDVDDDDRGGEGRCNCVGRSISWGEEEGGEVMSPRRVVYAIEYQFQNSKYLYRKESKNMDVYIIITILLFYLINKNKERERGRGRG